MAMLRKIGLVCNAAGCIGVAVLCGCASPARTAGPMPPPAVQTSGGETQPARITGTSPEDPFPVMPVRPATATATRATATAAMVGAVQTSQRVPVRTRPQPLFYGLITGHEPFDDANRRRVVRVADAGEVVPTRAEIARENEKSKQLEQEIVEETRRQERLMEQLERESDAGPPPLPGQADLADRADPRSAPETPSLRRLPRAIFDEKRVTIEPGTWNNDWELRVVRRVLDADQDGNAEQVRYYTADTDVLLRAAEDTNFDGNIDSWTFYDEGELVERRLDSNDDGQADTWERYHGTRMTERKIDRDYDGTKDAFYTYRHGGLVEEQHDPDNDGTMNSVSTYDRRKRIETKEDRSGDGSFDHFTTYHVVDGVELVKRVERDTNGDGARDRFEEYTASEGQAVLTKREEDKTGDGQIDITSIYENGRLVRREISDPSLLP
ncbi:hypothetical protein MK489_00690 [Myxococcota bacterium]|nr:hypothetical protein [Myxococcota bacterium]